MFSGVECTIFIFLPEKYYYLNKIMVNNVPVYYFVPQ